MIDASITTYIPNKYNKTLNQEEIFENQTDHAPLPFGVILIKNLAIPVLTIIFLVGMVGNTLTVIVLRTKRLSQSSTAIYLTALAVVDILYLLSSLLIHIVNYTFLFPNELRNHSALACSLCPFLQYTLTFLSVWLIVAVTVDRAIWVTRPFQAKHICTKRNATYTVTVMTVTLISLDSHFFWTMHYGTSQHPAALNGECRSGPFTERIFPYIDLLLIFVIPFAFMLASNMLIGWQLKKMRDFGRRRQLELSANLQPVLHEAGHNPQSIGSMAITYEYSTSREGKPLKRLNGHESRDSIRMRTNAEKSSALTTMLVAISVFFMISVSPLMVYDVIYFAVDLGKWIDKDEHRRSAIIFGIERFVYTLWYTNFAVHFILYCLNGPPFRAKAMQLFHSQCLARLRNINKQYNDTPSPKHELTTFPVPRYTLQPSVTDTPSSMKPVISRLESQNHTRSVPIVMFENSSDTIPVVKNATPVVSSETGQTEPDA